MKKHLLLLPAAAMIISCGGGSSEHDYETETYEESPWEKEQRAKDSILKLDPVLTSFNDALQDTMEWEHNVIIEGYIQMPSLTTIGGSSQSVEFFGRKNQSHGSNIRTSIKVGSGNNQMRGLPEKYSLADFKIKDNQGNPVSVNERVKLTGKVYASIFDDSTKTIYFDVDKIEKIEDVALDYASLNWPVLTKKESENEKNRGKEYMLEGTIDVPMFVYMDDDITVNLKDAKGTEFRISIMLGDESGQMEPLPEGWGSKDIKIYDVNGKMINHKQKVKVYGTLSYGGTLQVEAITQ